MNSKKAVIDIGTNTFHLLIAEVDENKEIKVFFKKTIPVKLGEGGVDKGVIATAAYERGINALIEFRNDIDLYHIKKVKATATAATRDAINGKDFIDEAMAKADIKISIIDGLKEAEYIYLGAKASGVLDKHITLIMDIGGGSVEFIIANENEILWKKSYQLGAARLLAIFYHEDPISASTKEQMKTLFETNLPDLFEAIKIYQPKKLIGTAGSFDSFASIDASRKNNIFNPENQKNYLFSFKDFGLLLNEIINSTHQERLAIKGLIPLRVDMILMATILTKYIIEKSKIDCVITCTYSLKEGLLIANDDLN
jgi:exopolyphosphatase/guanosine-5'-triphosphate,3'-diphosphate pyrophosphatase